MRQTDRRTHTETHIKTKYTLSELYMCQPSVPANYESVSVHTSLLAPLQHDLITEYQKLLRGLVNYEKCSDQARVVENVQISRC
eukprot:2463106-Pyramimonas_sp.AAC.1